MPCSEIAPATFLILFNTHVWVAKSDTLYLIAICDIYNGLLFSIAGFALGYSARIVELYTFAFISCHYAFATFLALSDRSFLWTRNLLDLVCVLPDMTLPLASLWVAPLCSLPFLK
jgi:hypothetical protein